MQILGICGVWIKRGEDDKSLISLFAFHCPVFAKASAHKGLRREEQTQVAWSPRGVAGSKITQFTYFGQNFNAKIIMTWLFSFFNLFSQTVSYALLKDLL